MMQISGQNICSKNDFVICCLMKILTQLFFNDFHSKTWFEHKLVRIRFVKQNTFTFHETNVFSLKLVPAIFHQILIFSQNDSPLKTMKNVFYFI